MAIWTFTLPLTWTEFAYYTLASFLAASGWYSAWKGRNKPEVEIEKSKAETRKIDAEVTKTYNDIIRDINKDLREAEVRIYQIKEERDRAITDREKLEQQVEDLIRSNESKERYIGELIRNK